MDKVKLAEFIGIMLGGGNLYHAVKARSYFIRVCNDTLVDKEYRKYVKSLFKDLFNKEMRSYQYQERETVLVSYGKDIMEFLEYCGLKRGNKKLNDLGIPKWILRNRNYSKACIRGLIDTDGGVFIKSRNPRIPQIEISSRISKLRRDYRKALINLGFKPSKWSKNSNPPNCGLYGKEQVIKYYNEIGFSNSKHKNKFDRIMNDYLILSKDL